MVAFVPSVLFWTAPRMLSSWPRVTCTHTRDLTRSPPLTYTRPNEEVRRSHTHIHEEAARFVTHRAVRDLVHVVAREAAQRVLHQQRAVLLLAWARWVRV